MSKRGELTAATIVPLVLAIAGFLIVMFLLLYKLDIQQYSEDDTCRLSVLSRATAPESVNTYIPLKCATKKICLSDGSGKCDNEFLGVPNVEVIDLPKDTGEAAKTISKVHAEALYNCWDMMGQGKLSLFSGGAAKSVGLTDNKVSCTICSRIAVDIKDERVRQETLASANVVEYMKSNVVPGKQITFAEAFTDRGFNSVVSAEKKAEQMRTIEEITTDQAINGDQSGRETAIVFSQIASQNYGDVLDRYGQLGVGLVGGSFLAAPITTVKALTSLPVLGVAAAAGGAVVGYSMYNVYQGRATAAGYCDDKLAYVGTDGKPGCSVVQALPYDVDAINANCEIIEGSP